MAEEISTDEEEEFRKFPKEDRSKLYSIIFIVLFMLAIYISIIINQFWMVVFIIIPMLSITSREEVPQAKRNVKYKIINGFSILMKLALISSMVGTSIYLLIRFGILISAILIFISFILYIYITTTFTRINFEKNNRVKSEVF